MLHNGTAEHTCQIEMNKTVRFKYNNMAVIIRGIYILQTQ